MLELAYRYLTASTSIVTLCGSDSWRSKPFLNPVPSPASHILPKVLLPLGYVVGVVRMALVLVIGLLYFLLVEGVCMIFLPIPPLYRGASRVVTALLTRAALFLLGFYWIPTTVASRRRGRAGKDASSENWTPLPGDLIVSNWVSWVELLWFAFRFNPVFVIPIAQRPIDVSTQERMISSARKAGRKTGTGSANITMPTPVSTARARAPIRGFKQVSLLRMISLTGRFPPFGEDSRGLKSLDEIRKSAGRPVVVFPECTTSNGRALLQFADVFSTEVKVPVKGYSIYIVCIRYDPPTPMSQSLTLSIAPLDSPVPNPMSHLFHISTSLLPRSISIRLLPPSESPSSATFMVSDIIGGTNAVLADNEILRDSCEVLIAGMGKMKRTQLAWEDKGTLLEIMKK